jgi:hypothetical protein
MEIVALGLISGCNLAALAFYHLTKLRRTRPRRRVTLADIRDALDRADRYGALPLQSALSEIDTLKRHPKLAAAFEAALNEILERDSNEQR